MAAHDEPPPTESSSTGNSGRANCRPPNRRLPVIEEPAGRLEGEKRTSLAAWLALGVDRP